MATRSTNNSRTGSERSSRSRRCLSRREWTYGSNTGSAPTDQDTFPKNRVPRPMVGRTSKSQAIAVLQLCRSCECRGSPRTRITAAPGLRRRITRRFCRSRDEPRHEGIRPAESQGLRATAAPRRAGLRPCNVDKTWLLLNATVDLDPPHVRVLQRLAQKGDRYHGVVDYELAQMFRNGTTLLYPLLKTLERHGLAGPLSPSAPGDPDGPIEWAIWDFGLLLTNRIFPASRQ